MWLPGTLFTFKLEKQINFAPSFGEWNFLVLILRNIFWYFKKGKPKKNSLYFRKWNFLISHETFHTSGSNFRAPKMQKTPCDKTFYISKHFLPPSLKTFFYFRRELEKPKNQKFLTFLITFLTEPFKHKRKRRNFLYFP